MRTPTSSSPDRSPEIYKEEQRASVHKQDLAPKPSRAELLKEGNDRLTDLIKELQSFDVGTIQRRSDPKIKALTGRINDTIAEIFGRDTDEYDDHVIWSLDTLPMTIGGSWYPLPEVREGYQKGIQGAITKLSSLVVSQEKKIKVFTSEKQACPAPKEPIPNPVLVSNEKVSLVNLRGKIKSRETILFSQPKPVSGNGQTPTHIAQDSIQQTGETPMGLRKDNHAAVRMEKQEIPGGHGDIRSEKEKPPNRKDVVLLENLEEKLKKLEKEMPVAEEAGCDEVAFSTLMSKLNEIVASEPEYAEAYTKKELGSEEEGITTTEDDYLLPFVINGEAADGSLIHMGEFASSANDADGQVLIIDGDNTLSSESTFMETLEAESVTQFVVDPDRFHGNSNIQAGMKRISLEELEEKLREFEEKEITTEIFNDVKGAEYDEVLVIGDGDELPEDMLSELGQDQAGMVGVLDAKISNTEVLVIDGNGALPLESASIELVQESIQEDEAADVKDEILVIECDDGLPDDVSDELPNDENLCGRPEGESHTIGMNEILPENYHPGSISPEYDNQLIIDLFSQTTPLEISLYGKEEITTREVLLEDFELRMCGTLSASSVQEFLNSIQCFEIEEKDDLSSESKTPQSNTEEYQRDSTEIVLPLRPEGSKEIVAIEHTFVDLKQINEEIFESTASMTHVLEAADMGTLELENVRASIDLPIAHNEEIPFTLKRECAAIDDYDDEHTLLELSEQSVYGEIPNLHIHLESLYLGDNEAFLFDPVFDQNEDDKYLKSAEQTLEKETDGAQVAGELQEQISSKELMVLSDDEHETPIIPPDTFLAFEPTFEPDERVIALVPEKETAIFDSVVLSDAENVGQPSFYDYEEEIPQEAMSIMFSEELRYTSAKDLGAEKEVEVIYLPEEIYTTDEIALADDDLQAITDDYEFTREQERHLPDETILLDISVLQPIEVPSFGVDQINTIDTSEELHCESASSQLYEILSGNTDNTNNNMEIIQVINADEKAQDERQDEVDLIIMNDIRSIDDLDLVPHVENLEMNEEGNLFDGLKNMLGVAEPLSIEAFEKYQNAAEHEDATIGVDEDSSRDNILLEALEEMLSNLETSVLEQAKDSPIHSAPRNNPPQEVETIVAVDSYKEPPKKAILIKNTEERNNPFAITDPGKEKSHAKTLRADDLLAQIGELRYRIDDLKTFDVDSIEQRFDPRVRALGDTVNNTLAEIFGRNTPAYWQHALPSLDSLPVVVGGPKLSPEELRDAYRRRINDAISKVNITIDILDAKLGNLQEKGPGGQVLFFSSKEHKYSGIQSLR